MATQSRFVANKGLDNNNKTIVNVTNPVNQSDVSTRSHFSDASNLASGTLDMARIPDMATMFAKSSNGALIKPSLNLNFAKSNTLDSRITFTRASSATRVNRNGLIEVVGNNVPRFDYDPFSKVCNGLLIEEQRTNLLTYSNNFDNGIWIKGNMLIIPNIVVAPNGSLTASKMVELTATSQHLIYEAVSTTLNTVYTHSVYAKAAEWTTFMLQMGSGGPVGKFDLVNKTAVATSGATAATIIDVGNGWFRCTVTGPSNGDAAQYIYKNPSSYTGDGISGIYIWGAQLEAGSFATSYIPSTDTFTSRASTATYIGSDGLIKTAAINTARYSYNPSNLSVSPQLLLEAASTNLLTYSEQFDVWTQSNITTTLNIATSPTGSLVASKCVDSATNTEHLIQKIFVPTAATTYTFSVFLKAAERQFALVGFSGGGAGDVYVGVNITTGALVTTIGSPGSVQITPYGSGWYRISCTKTLPTAIVAGARVGPSLDGTTLIYTGDGVSGIYVWGAQLEQSSYPTSYIPTTSAQVTRAADVSSSAQTTRLADIAKMTGNNFSSWYNQSEGSIIIDFDSVGSLKDNSIALSISDTTFNNSMYITASTSSASNRSTYNVLSNGIQQALIIPTAPYVNYLNRKIATAYGINDFIVCGDDASSSQDTLGTPPKVNSMFIGSSWSGTGNYISGHIRCIMYYPQRLATATLQSLAL